MTRDNIRANIWQDEAERLSRECAAQGDCADDTELLRRSTLDKRKTLANPGLSSCRTQGGEMSKYTPGPWELDERTADPSISYPSFRIFGGDGNIIGYTAIPSGFYRSVNNSEANARLIAFAPELLEEFEALLRVCEQELDPKRTPEIAASQDIIAKAKGE